MNPLIDDYLKQKFGDDYQTKAQSDYDDRSNNINTGSFVSSIGDALAGRAPGSQNDYFNQMKKQAKEDTIGKVDTARNRYVKDMTDNAGIAQLQDQDKIRIQENDINNPQAKQVTDQLRRLGVQVPDGMNLADIKRNYGDAKSLNEIKMKSNIEFGNQKLLKGMEFQNEKTRDASKLDGEKQMAAYKAELERTKKQDPNQKMQAMSGTDKARYDNAVMTLKALDDMGAALDKGDNTMSMIGDNNYTRAARNATEAYGRMQSGGAINKDEEARFEKALPGVMDDKKMQRTKILKQREEMISRLKTLGFTPDEAGYSPKEFKYGADKSNKKTVTDRQVNQKTGQTRLVYSDGSTEIISSNVAGGK